MTTAPGIFPRISGNPVVFIFILFLFISNLITTSVAYNDNPDGSKSDTSIEYETLNSEKYDLRVQELTNGRVSYVDNKKITITREDQSSSDENQLKSQSNNLQAEEISIQSQLDSTPPILLVDDDESLDNENYYINALNNLGLFETDGFDYYEIAKSGSPGASLLQNYQLLIWFTSHQYQNTLTIGDQNALTSYLDSGGKLWLNGQDIGYDIGSTSFYTSYLQAVFESDGSAQIAINGTSGGVFDGRNYNLGGGTGSGKNDFPSDISAGPKGNIELLYNNDPSLGAAVSTNETYRSLYMAFVWEAISSFAERVDSMKTVITWMSLDLSGLDTTPPSLEFQSADMTIPYGVEGYSINWNFTDGNPDKVKILRNDTWVESQPFTNQSLTSYSLTNLQVGVHNFTATAIDVAENERSSSIFITVIEDLLNPKFTLAPDSYIMEYGSTNNWLVWNASDQFPYQYEIYQNGSLVNFGDWNNSVSIVTNIDGYQVGIHNVTVVVSDSSQNINSTTTWLDVVDTTAPIVVMSPRNGTITETSTGNTLEWQFDDFNPDQFVLFRNGTKISSGSWSNNKNISINIDGLQYGIYNYTIVGSDTSSNQVTDLIWITVTDEISPTITQAPSNQTLTEGDPDNSLTYTATDDNPDEFEFFINNTLESSSFWSSGSPITFDLSTLPAGYYNLTMIFYDMQGNKAIHIAWITINDENPPEVLTSPSDLELIEGDTDKWLNWTVVDNYPDEYYLYRNGTLIDQNTWNNQTQISHLLGVLSFGVYNYTIIILDSFGNKVVDTVWIDITEVIAPVFDFTDPGTTYSEGTSGHNLTWNGYDVYPDVYYIFRNGTLMDQGSWSDLQNITISIDNLSRGDYNYTIYLYDLAGNVATHSAIVTVIDTTNPELNSPSDIEYEEETLNNKISWSVSDLHPATYMVTRNGTEIISGAWSNGINVSINIDGLSTGVYSYIIIVEDDSGNSNSDEVLVTVIDIVPPLFTSVPDDMTYSVGVTGNTLEWIASDNHPEIYNIYRNGGLVLSSGTWVDLGTITYNVDGLALGTYNFTIVIFDESGNSNSDEVTVIVSDAPIFTSLPEDLSITNDTTGNEVSWTVEDANPDMFSVFKNGTEYDSGSWNSQVPIVIDVSTSIVGIYNFTIWVNDTNNFVVIDTVFVFVTDTPVISSPSDISYEELSTGNTISWTASDMLPDTYKILQNGTEIDNGTWSNEVDIIINVDGLSAGIYNYTIEVTDGSGNKAIDTVFVTVLDVSPPDVNSPPDISDYEETTSGNSITWMIGDIHPDYYNVTINGMLYITNTPWVNGSILVDIDGLTLGVYDFVITVVDESDNYSQDSVTVTVVDTTSPSLNSPSDIGDYEQTTQGNTITWTAGDPNAAYYNVTLDGAEYIPDTPWSNGSIVVDIDGLDLGIYTFVITVNDTQGNFAQDTVQVTVVDTTSPSLSSPSDIGDYEQTTQDNTITWTAGDPNAAYYNVTLDGAEYIPDTPWSNGSIVVGIDGLDLGIYTFVITVNDTQGNFAQDTVQVTVVDTTSPSLSSPSDIGDYEQTTQGNTITWTAGDPNAAYYNVTLDGVEYIPDTPWNNGSIVVDIDGLDLGIYTFVITVNDTQGNFAQDTVQVTVVDTTSPSLSSPSDIGDYEQTTQGNTITWTAGDPNAAYYNVTLDGAEYIPDTPWSNGSIVVDIDGLDLGIYTFVITVNDTQGNFAQDTVQVTVVDTTSPSLSSPSDISYVESTTGHNISWSVSDPNPNQYTIYLDGGINETGIWTSGTISITVDGLGVGVYNWTILVNDTQGNSNSDTVFVEVRDNSPPIIDSPSDITYQEGTNGNEISWTIQDNNDDIYTVYQNGTEFQSGTWSDGIPVNVSIDGLSMGDYNFTIVAYDSSGNSVTDMVIVIVEDQTLPTLVSSGEIQFEQGSNGNFVNFTATDLYPDFFVIYKNGTSFETGPWQSGIAINVSMDGITLGVWNMTMVVYDTSANAGILTVWVTVSDTTAPTFDKIPTNSTYEAGSLSNQLNYTVKDLNSYQFTLYRNMSFYDNGTWTSEIEFWINIDGLQLGYHNFTIVVYDLVGNSVNSTVWIQVEDTTIPTITSPPDNSYEQNSTEQISWTVTDLFNGQYEILKNGSTSETGNWISDIPINISISDFELGAYNLTIIATDISGNMVYDTIIISIIDLTNPEINSPPDITYDEGNTGNILTWISTDLNPGIFTIYQNGTNVNSSTWESGQEINYIVDNLNSGIYNFTIIVFDSTGNSITDTVIVTVTDTSPPSIISTPSLNTTNEHSTGNILHWNVTDDYPDVFEFYINNTFENSGNWKNGKNITIVIDDLSIGYYNITLKVYDETGNFAISSHFVTIIDELDPLITSSPKDVTMIEETSGNIISWTAEDEHPEAYQILLNNSQFISGTWSSGVSIPQNIDFLLKGVYNWTFIAYDTSGNYITDTVFVTVIDATSPELLQVPSDYEYNENSTGHTLSWSADDNYPSSYEIFIEGNLNLSDTWISSLPIEISVDGLSKGKYNFTLRAFDESGNSVSHSVIVTVVDRNQPIFVATPEDLSLNETDSSIFLVWNVTDSDQMNYTLHLDGNIVSQGLINQSTFIYAVDNLLQGSYNFTLAVEDLSGNENRDTVIISVFDKTAPELVSEPQDFRFHQGTIDVVVNWTATDKHPSTYTITGLYLNPISGQWTSGIPITISLDHLEPGNHTILITIEDESGNFVTSWFEVKVIEEGITESENLEFSNTKIVHEGDVEVIMGVWNTYEGNHPIANASITVGLYEFGRLIREFNTSTNSTGYYSLALDYSGLLPGNYTWDIEFSREGFETKSKSLFAEVIPHNYKVQIQAPPELIQGEDFWITATVYYNNGNGTNGLKLNEFGTNNLFILKQGKASNVTVVFEIDITHRDGNRVIISKSSISGSNGVAVITFTNLETEEMMTINSISASANSDYGISLVFLLEKTQLPEISEGNPGVVILSYRFLKNNSSTIITIIIGMFLLLIIIGYVIRRLRLRMEILMKELVNSMEELEGIQSIKTIIIQTQSGIPVYEKEIIEGSVDPVLISGFTSAISAFFNEFGGEKLLGFEKMERQGLSIISHGGDYSKLIFISDNQLPVQLLKKLKDAHRAIEFKHSETLRKDALRDGYYEDYEILPLFEENDVYLKLRSQLKFREKNLRRIQRIKAISRNLKDNISSLSHLFERLEAPSIGLSEIQEYFEDRGLNEETSARAILIAYRYQVLEPIGAEH